MGFVIFSFISFACASKIDDTTYRVIAALIGVFFLFVAILSTNTKVYTPPEKTEGQKENGFYNNFDRDNNRVNQSYYNADPNDNRAWFGKGRDTHFKENVDNKAKKQKKKWFQ